VTSNVVLPQVLKGNSIELEGEKLEITGLEDFPTRTFVYIPSAKAVVGGINVFETLQPLDGRCANTGSPF
jgi:hypothetical protein